MYPLLLMAKAAVDDSEDTLDSMSHDDATGEKMEDNKRIFEEAWERKPLADCTYDREKAMKAWYECDVKVLEEYVPNEEDYPDSWVIWIA